MQIFHAVVHKDTESAYGVSFPDLPGVFSAADTEEELLPQAVEALSSYFETEPMVSPSTLDAIREAASAELADGAYLLGVPFIEDESRSVKLTISTSLGVQRAIDAYAKRRKMTRSKVMTEAVLREIRGKAAF